MIKSYLLRVLLGGLIVGLLAWGASAVAPKSYEGFAQILIDQKAQTPSIPVNAAERSIVDTLDFGRSRTITTQVLQLTSFQNLADAAERTIRELNVPANEQEEFQPVNMRTNVFVDAEAMSDLITLRVHMSKPEYAREFAQQTYLAFEERNRTSSRELADRARSVLTTTMTNLEGQLSALDKEIEAVRTQSGLPALDVALSSDTNAIQRMREQRDLASIEAEGAAGRVRQLEAELAKTPKEVVSSTTEQYNSNLLQLESSLSGAKTERDRLRARFHDDAQQVIEANAAITRIEAEIKATKERLQASQTTTVNPNYQTLVGAVAEARSLLSSARERVRQAGSEYDRTVPLMQRYPEVIRKVTELQRRQTALERLYQTYSEQLRSLELSNFGRVTPSQLITPGTSLRDPVNPKPLQNGVIGFIVGLILSMLWAVRREATTMPIRSMAQLNALSFVPAYRSLPAMRTPYRGLSRAPHESYEKLVLNCLRSEDRPYRVAVFGISKDSGGSTAALNYAVSLSRRGIKSTIVVSDPKSSLKRYLKDKLPAAGATTQVNEFIKVLNATEMPLIDATSGHVSLAKAIQEQESDVTIFDLDVALSSADYAILAQAVHEAILLVRSDRVRSVDYAATQQALRDAGCPQITVVFTFASGASAGVEAIDAKDEPSALATS